MITDLLQGFRGRAGGRVYGCQSECKRLLQNLRHEARVQAVRDYYALRGIKKTKPACRDKFLSKEQYMKVILKAFYLSSFI